MIYCPSCGTANRDGSRFCNECGTKLPTATSSLCPTCGTPNPPNSLFCEKCGTRLIASLAEAPEEPEAPAPATLVPKGLSLPTKSPAEVEPAAAAQSAEEEVPEWMRAVQSAVAGTSESDANTVTAAGGASDQAAPEEVPAWLSDLELADQSAKTTETPTDELLPEWAQRLRTAPEAAQPSGPEAEIPDWLKALGTTGQVPSNEETPTALAPAAAEETLPWAAHLGASAEPPAAEEEELPERLEEPPSPYFSTAPGETPPPPPSAPQTPPAAEEMPDWLRDLRPAAGAEEALPDWLDELGVEEQPAPESMALSTGDSAFDWLNQLGATTPEPPSHQGAAPAAETPAWLSGAGEETQPQESAVVPDWMSALRAAAPQVDAEPTEEMPDWLREVEVEQPPLETAGAGETPDWMSSLRAASIEPEATAEEEGAPDWLKSTGLVAAGAAAESAQEQELPPESVAPQKPVTDWLSALRQAAPGLEAEQASAEEVPEWMSEESGVAPKAIGGPQAYDQEVPDWLRETGAVAAQPAAQSAEEIPEWLHEPSAASESAEAQPPAQPEEEGLPDWLKGLGVAAAGAAAAGAFAEERQPEDSTPQKPVTDWLGALRRAAPEIEAEQAGEEAEPEWLREESGAAPQAIGGVQSYDQEVPDWLREADTAATPSPSQAGEGLPDWLRETQPAPAVTSETPPVEESVSGETPDWLRELTPTAAVAGAAAAAEPIAEEPQKIEQPEVAAAAEPEAESRISKAAPVVAAGLAAAAVAGAAKKPEKAEAGPVEMPEWLKEINQEQQAAKTAIPVPPPETAGLTQAEIPAWLEALRPKEEAAAPQEAETPSETEGPLAGIANALPPAPIMGEMHGLSAKLQFAVSAEDQARAGVLKELLTQHPVAPASVEQFVVKASPIRHRALRWIVAFLIIAALLVPIGNDINKLTGLPLMPSATSMTVPPAVSSAAFEVSRVAQLPPNSKVLVVFDYDAAQAGELNRVAQALLQSPALRNAQIEVASLNAQGSALAQAVLQNLGLKYADLNFVPGQANGVQSLLAKAGDVKLIIELAASPDTVRWWAEQLKANRAAIPLVAGVSAGAEPLTMPYVQSGQVKGLVSGFPGAVAYLNATGMMNTYSQDQIKDYQIPLDALALANYVMVGLIAVGLIAALLRGAGRRSA